MEGTDTQRDRNRGVRYILFNRWFRSDPNTASGLAAIDSDDLRRFDVAQTKEAEKKKKKIDARHSDRGPPRAKPGRLAVDRLNRADLLLAVASKSGELPEEHKETIDDIPDDERRAIELMIMSTQITSPERITRLIGLGKFQRSLPGTTRLEATNAASLSLAASSATGVESLRGRLARLRRRGNPNTQLEAMLSFVTDDTRFASRKREVGTAVERGLTPLQKRARDRVKKQIEAEEEEDRKRREARHRRAQQEASRIRATSKELLKKKRRERLAQERAEEEAFSRLPPDKQFEKRKSALALAMDAFDARTRAVRAEVQSLQEQLSSAAQPIEEDAKIRTRIRKLVDQGDIAQATRYATEIDRSMSISAANREALSRLIDDTESWTRGVHAVPITGAKNDAGEYVAFVFGDSVNAEMQKNIQYARDTVDIALYKEAMHPLTVNTYRDYAELRNIDVNNLAAKGTSGFDFWRQQTADRRKLEGTWGKVADTEATARKEVAVSKRQLKAELADLQAIETRLGEMSGEKSMMRSRVELDLEKKKQTVEHAETRLLAASEAMAVATKQVLLERAKLLEKMATMSASSWFVDFKWF